MKKLLKIWFKWFLFFNIVIGTFLITMYKDNTNVFEKLSSRDTTIYIVIHHTATSGTKQLIDFYNYHKTEKQFNSIAYTFIIDKLGVIEQLHKLSEKTDHVGNYNDCSIGVCLEGDFNQERPTIFQQISLVILINYLSFELNISKENIKPHSFFSDTECPGTNFNFINFLKYIL